MWTNPPSVSEKLVFGLKPHPYVTKKTQQKSPKPNPDTLRVEESRLGLGGLADLDGDEEGDGDHEGEEGEVRQEGAPPLEPCAVGEPRAGLLLKNSRCVGGGVRLLAGPTRIGRPPPQSFVSLRRTFVRAGADLMLG